MNSFDWSTYDYDDTSIPKPVKSSKISTLPKKEASNFDWDMYEQPIAVEKPKEQSEDSLSRTLLQIPQGMAEATTPGILTGLWSLIANGEINDPEEIEQIRRISEREGVPFDEEKYLKAGQEALGTIPTVSNLARGIESRTGIELEPKTKLQKGLRLGSTAATFQPGSISQKSVAGVTAPAVSAGLQEVGVPEPFADLTGLGVGAGAGSKTPVVEISKTTKPSGLPVRQYENIKEPTAIPASKLDKISEKVESDFRTISDKIIKESPIGETFENLKNDPTFKQESRALLNQAQEIADATPGNIDAKFLKKEIADLSSKKTKGYSLSEYDKSYNKYVKDSLKDITSKRISFGEMVEQYRKNNNALGEYFEPGSSKAQNRAKRDALLDNNRAIANLMESQEPKLANVFKEGNSRWTKIMDAENVDSFVNELFEGKIDFKKMHNFFDKSGYDFTFKRALGEKGFKDFEGLLKDMLTTEKPYKMLKIAKEKGYGELAKTASAYAIDPHVGAAKAGFDIIKNTYRGLMNAMLDKPKIGINFKKAVNDLKKGDFKAAEKEFAALGKEID